MAAAVDYNRVVQIYRYQRNGASGVHKSIQG